LGPLDIPDRQVIDGPFDNTRNKELKDINDKEGKESYENPYLSFQEIWLHQPVGFHGPMLAKGEKTVKVISVPGLWGIGYWVLGNGYWLFVIG
jgi:hypothetical protein